MNKSSYSNCILSKIMKCLDTFKRQYISNIQFVYFWTICLVNSNLGIDLYDKLMESMEFFALVVRGLFTFPSTP